MEKTKNKWYKAISILLYVFASIVAASLLIILIEGITNTDTFVELLNKYQVPDENGVIELYSPETVKALMFTSCLFMLPSIAVMYTEAIMFGKYVYMTDQEAAMSYKACVIWTVVSFFLGGTIVGILAIVGLLTIHAKQKDKYLASVVTTSENEFEVVKPFAADAETAETKTDTQQAVTDAETKTEKAEKTEKANSKLSRLEALKESGALTDEEYQELKDKILK